MKRTLISILPFTLVALVGSSSVDAAPPSFDCAKAEGAAQQLVCKDEGLASLDRELSRLYRLAVSGKHMTPARLDELKATQRGWIKGRDDCWKGKDLRQCVESNYMIRIHELRQGYADARSQDDKGISTGPLVLACQGFDSLIGFTLVGEQKELVLIEWRNQTHLYVLTQERAASGAKYSADSVDGHVVLWNKGDEARLELPGQAPLQCKVEQPG